MIPRNIISATVLYTLCCIVLTSFFPETARAGINSNTSSLHKANKYYNEGLNYAKAEKHNEAIVAFKEAISIRPDHYFAYNDLGIAYLDPSNADAYFHLGVSYSRLGLHEKAAEAYRHVIQTVPGDADAHFNLGISYFNSGDGKSALKEYELLKEINSDLAEKLNDVIN